MTILNDTRKADFLSRVSDLGNAEGRGLNAKPKYVMEVVAMSADDVIGGDDSADVWAAFAEASARTVGHEKARFSNEKTTKVRTSETRRLVNLGKMSKVNPVDLVNRAVTVINSDAAKDLKGSTYEKLLKIASAQKERPALALNDEEILAAITPEGKEQLDEMGLLDQLAKRMSKIHNGSEKDPAAPVYPSPELAAAIEMIEKRLQVLEMEAGTVATLANINQMSSEDLAKVAAAIEAKKAA